ncbi:hypothetical protein GQ44DRAFT_636943, partial [Phaeosphaeriaceae sp. PMI808]
IKVLLKSLASFILERTSNKKFSSGLIYFLAILRINPKIERLRTAKNYLYILTSVVYYVRVIRLEKLLLAV